MLKVFNRSMRTFQLHNREGEKLIIPFKCPIDIPEEFAEDITFRKAVEAHELELYNTVKDVDEIEKKDEETEKVAKKTKKKTETISEK